MFDSSGGRAARKLCSTVRQFDRPTVRQVSGLLGLEVRLAKTLVRSRLTELSQSGADLASDAKLYRL